MSVNFEKPNKPSEVQSERLSAYNAPQADMAYDELSELDYHDEPFYSVNGRIGRLRFLAYSAAMGMVLYVAFLVFSLLGVGLLSATNGNAFASIIFGIIILVLAVGYIYATFAPAIRRFNDTNHTGWLSLLLLVPYLNVLVLLFLVFMPGTDGFNDYGVPARPPTTRVKVLALLVPIGLVVLIGILAAIALPAYQNYIDRADHVEQMYIDRMNNTP